MKSNNIVIAQKIGLKSEAQSFSEDCLSLLSHIVRRTHTCTVFVDSQTDARTQVSLCPRLSFTSHPILGDKNSFLVVLFVSSEKKDGAQKGPNALALSVNKKIIKLMNNRDMQWQCVGIVCKNTFLSPRYIYLSQAGNFYLFFDAMCLFVCVCHGENEKMENEKSLAHRRQIGFR